MDSHPIEPFDDLPSAETPEDVAVLYSWANLHGAKYRDFSASRREYRAQLRHRAAEQVRDEELQAQADAEQAAFAAEAEAREAEAAFRQTPSTQDSHRLQALQQAEQAAQIAAAERLEAARRAEAAADAQAAALREQREMAEAAAAARRQAALYTDPDSRRHLQEAAAALAVPGELSDPYPTAPRASSGRFSSPAALATSTHPEPRRMTPPRPSSSAARPAVSAPAEFAPEPSPAPQVPPTPRRPQGYRPDDASGVRQIYRGPESERQPSPPSPRREPVLPAAPAGDEREPVRNWIPAAAAPSPLASAASRDGAWERLTRHEDFVPAPARPAAASPTSAPLVPELAGYGRSLPPAGEEPAGELEDPTPRRRRQDQPGYRLSDSDRAIAAFRREQSQGFAYANAPRRAPETPSPRQTSAPASGRNAPAVPAWINPQTPATPGDATPEPDAAKPQPEPSRAASQRPLSVSDTLQRSRERVASRWYALKGVFEPGQERPEPQPVRQKETRTPILAVFSLAGGVGKTSLVATVGRSLSALGEKVLLTDTTSHGLLPFYFGASELRAGTVRTFSPPSGSTDAPIYMVNYAVDQQDQGATTETQDTLVEEIVASGRGAHRILLDLTASTGWLIRHMARLSPTILIPLAPDMNSIISLGALEKYLLGINGADGAPLKVFYVLNQFDASLPLHLDVREVLRRQLGDRLLPFVIRRAPVVSEALAEGMTVLDYNTDAPVAGDYRALATWLRTVSAPATAGFRNVRWSER